MSEEGELKKDSAYIYDSRGWGLKGRRIHLDDDCEHEDILMLTLERACIIGG